MAVPDRAHPKSDGVPASTYEQMVVLPYNDEGSLAAIRAQAGEPSPLATADPGPLLGRGLDFDSL
jgi:hypothetical protein